MSPANTTDPRRRLQPEQRREELVRVGVELFAEGTLDRTHVNEIIKRAGVSRTLFYHYFPSKIAFARAIGEYGSVVLIGGNIPRETQVTSQYIQQQIEIDRPVNAAAVSVALLLIAFVALFILRVVARRQSVREDSDR